MPDLDFQIEGAATAEFTASPQIAFKLRVSNLTAGETIHTVSLHCQIQIEVTRRRYTPEDKAKLRDLFGAADRWSQTLRNLLWTNVDVNVPAFESTTQVDLPVPCTFDFNVAATKYFHALGDADVPLCVMFSGTVFYSQDDGVMQVAPISWEKETRFSLPVKVWHDMMKSYYPGGAWLYLRRDVFERLYAYKVRHELPTWEQALESVLEAEETVRS
jgi:hypothetical protein